MTGSCDDCGHMRVWEEVYDFEGRGGEMLAECDLPEDVLTDEVCELAERGRCPHWIPIEEEDDVPDREAVL